MPSFVDVEGDLGLMSYSHMPSTCRSVTLQRFFAVLWTSRYGEPAGNSFDGLMRCGRKGFIIVWRREIGVDLEDRVEISIVVVCCGIVASLLWFGCVANNLGDILVNVSVSQRVDDDRVYVVCYSNVV